MRQRRLKAEINVVPYIDVMLVLLVIFMVAAPMMTTSSIDVPTVGKANTAPTAPLEVAIKADQTLTLTDRAGNGKEIRVDRKELPGMIRAAQDKNPEQPVLIAGDKNVKYEAVLSVMDELQRAQVKRVGLVVQTTGK
ncbi:protein TolR [Dechloromonas sp. TW-R-39-2]|uniref:protein TolR n=1 Tax=Dechloromonas sp. TW-R-39-2 TaxID=2654218 RepID=UPI00193E09B8|nr:protein TolR [Dechloromonas sp. TW-R-39-2]QRM18095.1 protein TolR [Dechloromonas sp. TW-R-39-2]